MTGPWKTRLPASLDELRGRRAALWVRESMAGQYDNFGPDAQRRKYELALEHLGLVATSIEWVVAHSGWRIAKHPSWSAMLAGAGVDYDVLVVGYASRFARSLEAHVDARRAFHQAGAVILFADDWILSSDERAWERWAREAVEAEAYSRRLSQRVAEGYAEKRRRMGIPGGNRAPLGAIRRGRELVIDGRTLEFVQRTYELAVSGATDREVALQVGLRPKHVAEILTNPFYRGELRTGEQSALGPLVDPTTWERVQALRSRYSRRHRGSVRRRRYALAGILACASCGRRLTGHSGRMRHVDACAEFKTAAPRRRRRFERSLDHRVKGESYPAELYEEAVCVAFEQVAVSSKLMTEVIALATSSKDTTGDALALARIEREREQAAIRFVRDRNLARLEAAFARLDAQAAAAAESPSSSPTAEEVRAYLEDLPRLWRETDTDGRRAIAEAVFERIDVLGVTEYSITPTPDAIAHGWDRAFGDTVIAGSIGRYGRGERISPATNDLQIRLRLSAPPAAGLRAIRSA